MTSLQPLLRDAIRTPDFEPDDLAVLVRLEEAIHDQIGPMAVDHDREGRYPTAAVKALKACGILGVAVPRSLGGHGACHAVSLEAQVRLAVADSAVAQIFKVHDEMVREIPLYCPDRFGSVLAAMVGDGSAIIGLAAAEDGKAVDAPLRTTAEPQADGSFVVDGEKIYTTGAAEADYIAVWAFDRSAMEELGGPGLQLNLIPPGAPGVTVHRDWDNLGQRATDSGRITFDAVRTDPALHASDPARPTGLDRPLRYQAGFAAVLVGIGLGAMRQAGHFLRERARPWPSAGVERASEDPLVERLTGELSADLAAAYHLVLATGPLLDAYGRGEITRTELAVPVSIAKSVASRAAIRATNEVFALMGTRSTRRSEHFDRYWRNARTLSLHDPVDWKHVEIGNHVLNGWDPPFGLYT